MSGGGVFHRRNPCYSLEITFNEECPVLGCAWILLGSSRSNSIADKEEDEDVCSDSGYLDRCLSKLPEHVDQSLMRRMPVSEKEVASLCRGFQIGMQCINNYSNKCLEPAKKEFLEGQSSGARKLYNSLCNDEAFKSDYLQHTPCFKRTQRNWESCVSQFTHLVREEIQKKNYTHETKVFQTCCAIHGFHRCVYVPGRLKCNKEDALFLLRIAEMSIDQREYDCNSINNYKICAGSDRGVSPASTQAIFLLFALSRLW